MQKTTNEQAALLRPIFSDLLIAGAVQLVALVLATCILDMGGFLLATRRLSAAYWCGVIIILVRRHNSLTPGDREYIRGGLIAVLILGIPVTLAVWALRGLV